MSTATVSYCVVCDAPPGECSHTGPRYLPDMVYEPAATGWRVPERERERYEHPVKATRLSPPTSEAQPLPVLVAALEREIGLDLALEHRLEDAYDRDALKVSRLVASVIRAVAAGRLENPGGLLWKRLGEVG